MQSLTQIRELLESRGLAPRHALGQNFLIDHNLIKKLVDAAHVSPNDTVLEVGPGTGTLTEELLARGATVIAGELDKGLASLLRDRFADEPRFTLVEGDALETKRALNPAITDLLGDRPFKLVANLPYAAATPVMSTLLLNHPRCSGLYVTIQREVADRLTAKAGTKEYGPLSIIAQLTATPRLIATLPLECFWPRPKVTSAMIAIERRPGEPATPNPQSAIEPQPFADFVQSLFEKRRKQLGAILGRAFPFPQGIPPTARAESLAIPQLIDLFKASQTTPRPN
jgi:16S rRNA (adenine1518-N6/adenine1519-N6)-dimethyltransferase